MKKMLHIIIIRKMPNVRLNIKHWQHQMLRSMWNIRNLFISGKNTKGCSYMDRQFGSFLQSWIKYRLTIRSSSHVLWYLSKWTENLCLHQNLHMDFYWGFTCNCQNLETIKMSSVVHQENRIIFDAKKKWAIKPWKDIEESEMQLLSERS